MSNGGGASLFVYRPEDVDVLGGSRRHVKERQENEWYRTCPIYGTPLWCLTGSLDIGSTGVTQKLRERLTS